MAWVQRPSGPIKEAGCASTFWGSYLGLGRECFIEAIIDDQSKSFLTKMKALTKSQDN
jgi:hypothetical protein